MTFSPDLFLSLLTTARFGHALRYLDETDSTIREAWRWLEEGGPDGGVVIAGRQRARGGGGGAAPGSPLPAVSGCPCSSAPELDAARVGRLGMVLALAAAEGVETTAGVAVGLKWPNDLQLEGRKLAGVLVETQLAADRRYRRGAQRGYQREWRAC